MKLYKKYNTEKQHQYMDMTNLFKRSLTFGILLFLLFMILDYFAFTIHYKETLLLRAIVIVSAILLLSLIAHSKRLLALKHELYTLQIFVGQFVLIVLIAIASSQEVAYRAYHNGLMLLLFWAVSMYRLNTKNIFALSVFTIIMYNIIEIFIHKLTIFDLSSPDFAWFLNNNMNIVITSVVVVLASYYMNKYYLSILEIQKTLQTQNENLAIKNIACSKAKNHAEQSDNLKSAFLANMSHEIRTPLNSIVGFSQLLDDKTINDKTRKIFVNKIQKNSTILIDIINDILEISKIESGYIHTDYENINISNLMESIYKSSKIKYKDSNLNFLEPIIELKNKTLFIDTDIVKLERIINNLLSNAFKFTGSGDIVFGFKKQKDNIVIMVKDTGIGIPIENMEIIFKPFVQINEALNIQYGGTGIGLAICEAYIKKMNGKIWVESKLDIGSTFYVSLPLEVKS